MSRSSAFRRPDGSPRVRWQRGQCLSDGAGLVAEALRSGNAARLSDKSSSDFIDVAPHSWILQPEDPWEFTGYVHNVVFTCGAVAEPDGTVKIYRGGADTVMCAGEAKIADLVKLCLEHGRPAK
jgi:beta-1,4-mannooligosaccharide phosphorylase